MRIREGFEGWLKQDKEDKKFAEQGNNDDISFDEIENMQEVNTRIGFPKYKKIMKSDE